MCLCLGHLPVSMTCHISQNQPLFPQFIGSSASHVQIRLTHVSCSCCALSLVLSQARVERMDAFQKKGEELEKALADSKKKLTEAQKKVTVANS